MLKLFLTIVIITFLSCTANKGGDNIPLIKNSIDENGFLAKVDYSYNGCFGGGKKQIVIKSNGDFYFATLKNEEGKVYKTSLNKFQMDTFEIFISRLREMKKASGLCTTSQQYAVRYGIEIIERTQGDCQWWGFNELEKCFFNLP